MQNSCILIWWNDAGCLHKKLFRAQDDWEGSFPKGVVCSIPVRNVKRAASHIAHKRGGTSASLSLRRNDLAE